MKKLLVVVLFLVVIVSSSCLAAPRRGMSGRTYGRHEQRYHVQKGRAVEGRREESKAEYTDSNIENHHNIPRQYYNDQGGTPQGDDGGSG
jgi:uncharacterized protein YxeA